MHVSIYRYSMSPLSTDKSEHLDYPCELTRYISGTLIHWGSFWGDGFRFALFFPCSVIDSNFLICLLHQQSKGSSPWRSLFFWFCRRERREKMSWELLCLSHLESLRWHFSLSFLSRTTSSSISLSFSSNYVQYILQLKNGADKNQQDKLGVNPAGYAPSSEITKLLQ